MVVVYPHCISSIYPTSNPATPRSGGQYMGARARRYQLALRPLDHPRRAPQRRWTLCQRNSAIKSSVFTSNKAAALAVCQPRQQSGQGETRHIYHAVETLRENGNIKSQSPGFRRAGTSNWHEWLRKQHVEVRHTTPFPRSIHSRPYLPHLALRKRSNGIPKGCQKERESTLRKSILCYQGNTHASNMTYSPGRKLCVLAQLRTGMARLNGVPSSGWSGTRTNARVDKRRKQ